MSSVKSAEGVNQDRKTSGEVSAAYISPVLQVEPLQNVDDAMQLAIESETKGVAFDPEKDKRLLLKIDLYLLPLLCFLYALQFMDKTTNSYTAVMGLKEDLHMTGSMYSWCGTAFNFGYLIFEFPANYLLQRYPLAKTTAIFIFIWGALLCLHAVPNYAGFIALRVLLGVFESAISPAMVILTGQWYRKEEHFTRTSIWFSCNGIGIIMGGAIAYGCALHSESYSFAAWKVLFVVTGLMSVAMSFIFWLHIPDAPSKAWFLTEEEKLMVVERIRENKQGFGNHHFKKYQFLEALKDPLTWLFALFAIASNIPNGALTNFGSLLMTDDFHFDSKKALLMQTIGGGVEVVGCIGLVYLTRIIPHRLIVSLISMCITFFASSMLAFANQNKTARLTGYYIQYVLPVTTICSLSCFQSNAAGHTKKTTSTAIYLIAYCVVNIVGPQTFRDPPYTGGKIAIVACEAVGLVLIIALYVYYLCLNKMREKGMNEMDPDHYASFMHSEFADLTDKENPTFRYCL